METLRFVVLLEVKTVSDEVDREILKMVEVGGRSCHVHSMSLKKSKCS